MNSSPFYQPALELNRIVEDIHSFNHLKCHLFYTPHFFSTRPIQQKMRISIQHRQSLRRTILQKLSEAGIKFSHKQQKAFCDINNLPSMPNGFISVSHCPGLQGFIYTSQRHNSRIGLDVEVRSRVTMNLVSFLSNKFELDNMPNPSCLWTAKEASFKCLYPQNIRISQIIIRYQEVYSNCLYRFVFSSPCGVNGQGYSYIWKQWTIAFAHT